jgi:hypothetical protein
MKTAMQELINDLSNNMVISIFERLEREGIFIKALKKEKEQIIDAYYGKINGVFGYREEGKEYYNQTYKPETI